MSSETKLIRDENSWKALSQYLFTRLVELEDLDDKISPDAEGWNNDTLEAMHIVLTEVLEKMVKIEEGKE